MLPLIDSMSILLNMVTLFVSFFFSRKFVWLRRQALSGLPLDATRKVVPAESLYVSAAASGGRVVVKRAGLLGCE